MRGKAEKFQRFAGRLGITPACAGKSGKVSAIRREAWDHPRVCGEKFDYDYIIIQHLGSPPRVRGKGLISGVTSRRVGITPACAGKRSSFQPKSACTRDHPRVCGEKIYSVRDNVAEQGSPPRVRGKVARLRFFSFFLGITPACAGKRLKRSHSIGHFSCILCLFHSVLHRASVSGGSRAGPCAPPCLPAQNAVPV